MEEVILVDEKDRPIGSMEKLKAHQSGSLHRAFSVFIFNSEGLMLIQKRARDKYHSGGLLTNACCSHPRPGENTLAAANRRLMEEMGIDCPLTFKTTFIYKAVFDNQLTEHELDHLFIGIFDGQPKPDPTEVETYHWLTLEEIKRDMQQNPEMFTVWFKLAMNLLFP